MHENIGQLFLSADTTSTMKTIVKTTKGYLSNVGPEIKVRRVIPSVEIRDLNPFIFLDVMVPKYYEPNTRQEPTGTGAHPHRGFVTLTYMLEGEIEHFDSYGNRGVVQAGGLQWMKAGKGIVHDERPTPEFLKTGGTRLGFQLWVNLPAANKEDEPDYLPLVEKEVPAKILEGGTKISVLMGEYQDLKSPVPIYSPMAIYRLNIPAGATVNLEMQPVWVTGVYLNSGSVRIGEQVLEGPRLATLTFTESWAQFTNVGDDALDLFVFTARPLTEPMLAHGPFVMSDEDGIIRAYRDYEAGKYGVISNYPEMR